MRRRILLAVFLVSAAALALPPRPQPVATTPRPPHPPGPTATPSIPPRAAETPPSASRTAGSHVSGAWEALTWWGAQRAYPNAAIPDVGYAAAFEAQHRPMAPGPVGPASPDPWESIGPTNIGGRTLALAIDPQNPSTIWAGSASGGLWVSHTGGKGFVAWEYVPTGFPVLGVSTIAIAPDDSSTIYIGTGEVYNYQETGHGYTIRPTRGSYGIGVLKTTDGGATWAKSLDWSSNQRRGVWAVRIHPLDPDLVWAGTTDGTYRSTDAGLTWARVDTTIMAMDLAVDPTDLDRAYIGCGNLFSPGHGLYRTTDRGETWAKMESGLPPTFGGKAMLHVAEASPNIVYASIGNGTSSQDGASWLCRSTDRGDTWEIRTTEDYTRWQGWFAHDVAASPVDPDLVIAIGVDIYRSTTGGTNLSQVSFGGMPMGRVPQEGPDGPPQYTHSDKHDIVWSPTDPDVVYFATDGGVFRSLDAGLTFESCNGGLQTTQFYQGFSTSNQDFSHAIGGLQDNGTIVYDGVTQWIRVIGGDGSFTAIDAADDARMFGSWQELNILESTDRGETWFYIPSPADLGDTPFIAPFILGVNDPSVLYAGRSHVFRTTNDGGQWTTTNGGDMIDGNMLLAFGISHQTTDLLYATTAPTTTRAHVFRTLDGGATWDDITGTLPDRYMVDVVVDPANDLTVYVALSGFGTSHLFRSRDAGGTWEDIGQGLPDVPTNAVAIDPLHTDFLYAGNDLGVYASTDDGATWFPFDEGLPDAVIAMDLNVSETDRTLRVATHGNGAYMRRLLEKPVGIGDDGGGGTPPRPRAFALHQNAPNPFNPSTVIAYEVPGAGAPARSDSPPPGAASAGVADAAGDDGTSDVELTIYDLHGRKVRTLVAGPRSPGRHEVAWDGRDDRGRRVASGAYLYRLRADGVTRTRKMTLVE